MVLVGYDCSLQTAFIGMARTLKHYGIQRRCLFKMATAVPGYPQKTRRFTYLNASRSSAIQCFPRINLEAVSRYYRRQWPKRRKLCCAARRPIIAVNGAIDWLNRASYFFNLIHRQTICGALVVAAVAVVLLLHGATRC